MSTLSTLYYHSFIAANTTITKPTVYPKNLVAISMENQPHWPLRSRAGIKLFTKTWPCLSIHLFIHYLYPPRTTIHPYPQLQAKKETITSIHIHPQKKIPPFSTLYLLLSTFYLLPFTFYLLPSTSYLPNPNLISFHSLFLSYIPTQYSIHLSKKKTPKTQNQINLLKKKKTI